MNGLILLVLILSSSATSWADEVPLSDNETLFFTRPATFQFEVAREPDDQFRPSMKFSHFGSDRIKDFGFKLFINKGTENDLQTEQAVKEFTMVDCEQAKEGSVEGRVSLHKVPGTNMGYYCSFTDASIPVAAKLLPGQYRNITVGFVKSGLFGFNVIAFSNGTQGPLFSDFLTTLGSLTVCQRK